VVLNAILGLLAALSLVLLLWQWIVAMRFPLHHRDAPRSDATPLPATPGVTLLKPLKGADEFTEECLASWFNQKYGGPIQILLAVADAADPACEIVRRLIERFPALDAQLVICGPLLGTNAKVSKLVQLGERAKHDLLVISDADVRVPPDLLAKILPPLYSALGQSKDSKASASSPPEEEREGRPTSASSSGGKGEEANIAERPIAPTLSRLNGPTPSGAGLVNCFYSLANPCTPAMRWEAIAINADFWSQVLQAQSLKPLDFALGAVMATTRRHLREIGGFRAIVNCLADDYQLGNRIARAGHRILLATVPVECFSGPMGWAAVWRHQMRWARTIRVSQPVPYFFSILSNPTLWPLVWAVVVRTPLSASFLAVALLLRIVTALVLEGRLTRKSGHYIYGWLVPVKDLLQATIWAGAFMGNTIEWRGQKMRLLKNGELEGKAKGGCCQNQA
jgi:ceramide glucosyltransferase